MPTGESYRPAKKRQLVRDGSSTDFSCPPRKSSRIRLKAAAAEPPITKLGDDLLQEILIRLPNPRSACRCKRVCKRWNSMLSNPCFNRRFVSHHQRMCEALGEPPLLLPSDDPLPPILSFLPVPDEIRSKFVIWDSFKDLVLCGFQDWWGQFRRLFIICNPFTKQWVTLPVAPERFNRCGTPVVKLVCKEARNDSHSLDLGDHQAFLYSDYRFRVLLEYNVPRIMMPGNSSELQVFCSKSRKWSSRKGLGLQPDAISLDGKLYLKVDDELRRFDPFRQNIRPTTIDDAIFRFWRFNVPHFSTSNGALYLSMIESGIPPADYHEQGVLTVWRWEEGSMKWMACYQTSLKTLKCAGDSKVEGLKIDSVLAQHPEQSEIFFLKCFRNRIKKEAVVFSYDFRTGYLEFVADKVRYNVLDCWTWMVFQPRTTCFSTPIPSYKKLLGMYNGIYGDLVQTRRST